MGWVPDAPTVQPSSRSIELPTDSVRFSQSTVGERTRLGEVEILLGQLVGVFNRRGFVSEPIEVVAMPDGRLTSIDNRRLLAAQLAGLALIPAILHRADTPMPHGRRRNSLRARDPITDHLGEFGPRGALLFEARTRPNTMSETIIFRCARQVPLGEARYPLSGSFAQPVIQPATARVALSGVGRGTGQARDPVNGRAQSPARPFVRRPTRGGQEW